MTRKQALLRLGIQEEASPDEIKRAYRKLAFELHPDLHPNNPNAGKEFQLLNEAYVLLSTPPPADGGRPRGQSRASARAEATEKARTEAYKAYERAKKRFQNGQGPPPSGTGAPGPEEGKTREKERDEVLRDLLRDPFARRVFEDIYSQIREEAARKQPRKNTAPNSTRAVKRPEPSLLERTADNVSDWLRRQVDEEQTVKVAGPLTPGKKLRLQIHQGIFGETRTIEVTLPPGFEPGRPLRLKGLGKRIGKWHGDLYLRITN